VENLFDILKSKGMDNEERNLIAPVIEVVNVAVNDNANDIGRQKNMIWVFICPLVADDFILHGMSN